MKNEKLTKKKTLGATGIFNAMSLMQYLGEKLARRLMAMVLAFILACCSSQDSMVEELNSAAPQDTRVAKTEAITGPVVYGFYTKFGSTGSATDIANMAKYHINFVQFYDWQNKHHIPLAGTVTSPSAEWKNIFNATCYKSKVEEIITASHNNGMKAMNYNLIYGAYEDYATDGSGVDPAWGLYNKNNCTDQWQHSLPSGWATPSLRMFNPANTNWANYIYNREKEAMSVYKFDGFHMDQLGNPGTKYSCDGKVVDVWPTFVDFIKNAPGTIKVFNNVDGYGEYSVLSQSGVDFAYIEVWSNETYAGLKKWVDDARDWSGGKPVVIAHYAPGCDEKKVLLEDATIIAAGGTKIELGDGEQLLKGPFFPDNCTPTSSLKSKLKCYYDFLWNNQTYLYGNYANSTNKIVLSIPSSTDGKTGTVWTFAKVNSTGSVHTLALINLNSQSKSNFTCTYYHGKSSAPTSVKIGSPDIKCGTWSNASFTTGSDSNGNYIKFNVPSIIYWDEVVVSF